MAFSATRRALLGQGRSVAAVGALLALPSVATKAAAAISGEADKWGPFTELLASMHPKGRKVAELAQSKGLRLDDLQMMIVINLHGERADHLPALWFATGDERVEVSGEDVS